MGRGDGLSDAGEGMWCMNYSLVGKWLHPFFRNDCLSIQMLSLAFFLSCIQSYLPCLERFMSLPLHGPMMKFARDSIEKSMRSWCSFTSVTSSYQQRPAFFSL